MRIPSWPALTALVFGVVCTSSAWGVERLNCQALFDSLPPSRTGSRFLTTPKSLRARNRLSKAKDSDPRLAMIQLIEASPRLNRLDNFTAPALAQTVIFNWQNARAFETHLNGVVARATLISTGLRELTEVPAHVAVLLDLIETRYRAAIEIVGLALEQKSGKTQSLDASLYVKSLFETVVEILAELRADRVYGNVFSDFDLGAVDWRSVAARVEDSVRLNPPLGYHDAEKGSVFLPRFWSSVDVNQSIFENIKSLGFELDDRLRQLPVGVYHRLADLTSSVRFGPFLFFGNHGDYRKTPRGRYIRTRTGRSSTTEVVLRMRPRRKKLTALLLDRAHRSLDPLFGLPEVRGRHGNTCGSYVPVFFTRCGVPVIAPAYLTPGAAAFSLAMQKYLPFGNIEHARVTYAKDFVDIPEDIFTLGGHELLPTGIEFAAYLGLGFGIERLLSWLL